MTRSQFETAKAEECERLAAFEKDPAERKAWLQMAERLRTPAPPREGLLNYLESFRAP